MQVKNKKNGIKPPNWEKITPNEVVFHERKKKQKNKTNCHS